MPRGHTRIQDRGRLVQVQDAAEVEGKCRCAVKAQTLNKAGIDRCTSRRRDWGGRWQAAWRSA